jgi:hypothetical protein
MSDGGKFALNISAFCAKAKQRSDLIVRKIALDVDRRIMERSPVGDASYWKHPAPKGYVGGRFRANWQLEIGSIPMGTLDAIDPSGERTLAGHLSVISQARAGVVIYLSNNLPYARRIEDGWSHQSPQGVVGLTVMEFQSIVDAAAKEIAQ